MFGSKHLITSWDAFHLFIKMEIGVVGFALFCYFFPSFFPFLFCKERVRKKRSTCTSSMHVPSPSPLCLPASPVAPEQRSSDGEEWSSLAVCRHVVAPWKLEGESRCRCQAQLPHCCRGSCWEARATCQVLWHMAGVLEMGGLQPGPPVPGQPRFCLQWAAEQAAGDKPCLRLPGALSPCLARWGSCVMGAETGLVLPL